MNKNLINIFHEEEILEIILISLYNPSFTIIETFITLFYFSLLKLKIPNLIILILIVVLSTINIKLSLLLITNHILSL